MRGCAKIQRAHIFSWVSYFSALFYSASTLKIASNSSDVVRHNIGGKDEPQEQIRLKWYLVQSIHLQYSVGGLVQ
jgi:hypothetical protein